MTACEERRKTPKTAGYFTFVCFAVLSVICSPKIVEKAFSLDWWLGNIRDELIVLQILFGIGALASIVFRRRIDGVYANLFSQKRHLYLALVCVAIALPAAIGIGEVGLRILSYPFKSPVAPEKNALAVFDPELGWSYIPNKSAVSRVPSQVEASGHSRREVAAHFDRHGARIASPQDPLDPAKATVLFVGGSYAMGHGLTYEESFIGRLPAYTDIPAQYANFGVQGFATDQALLMLKRQIREFDTRLAVYVYIRHHEMRNLNADRRLIHPFLGFPGTKPAFGLKDDGTLYLRNRPHEFGVESYVWNLLKYTWHRIGPKPDMGYVRALTRALVRDMKATAEEHGARFMVVYWATDPDDRDAQVFEGLGVEVIEIGLDPPPGWASWQTPDRHYDSRAADYAARVLAPILEREWKDPSQSRQSRHLPD